MGKDYDQKYHQNGTTRNYILHEPTGYDGTKALPLVFMLPGFNGTAHDMWNNDPTGMTAKAEQEGFFVAYLEATGCIQPNDVGPCRKLYPEPPPNPAPRWGCWQDPHWGCAGGELSWNAGLAPTLGVTIDDVDYVRGLLAYLETQWAIDSQRVYAVGMSNGAFMCHRLGALLSDKLAAVAIVEGTIGVRQSDCSFATIPDAIGPIPVMMIHGEKDTHVQYYGGQGSAGPWNIWAKSVADAVIFWVQQNHCQWGAVTQTSPNAIRWDFTGSSPNSAVTLITLVNGEHEWPKPHNAAHFPGTKAIWEFFSQHPPAAPNNPGTSLQVDPIALALANPIPLVFTLPDPPPPYQLEAQIRQVVQTMTPEQKASALARVNVLNTYANAVAKALNQG
jgi:polyhydroxybutyrate depolymerase